LTPPYQLLDPLLPEERAALRADIEKRGVMVPVEKDEAGNVLDGHNRAEIAGELGIDYPEVVRTFKTEEEKREHVIKLNLARRHLDPLRWGRAFKLLCEVREIATGQGSSAAKRHSQSATVADLATELGVPPRTARDRMKQAEAFDALPEAEKEKVRQRKSTVRGASRQNKKRQQAAAINAEPPPLPAGPFRVLVIDPPWEYASRGDDPTHRAGNPYPSMTPDAIRALPVAALACDDAVLWLWATNAHLPLAFGLVEAWGFTYKTCLTWVKNKIGTGDWLRGQTEHCLLAVRGKPTVTLKGQSTALPAPARKHSEKPEEFYALVEALCPGSKVELFSRKKRKGWNQHGDELR
jgi:N6-adenosine-specific RNA methylase IME4/ParB-like chromosome segregation protein Spo0J